MGTDDVAIAAHEFRGSGRTRRYLVISPRGLEPATLPVIIDLHGSGSSPEEHVSVTDARPTAAAGAIVVVPQADISFRLLADWPSGWAWNVPGSPLPGESTARDEPDDIAFISALITRLVEQHRVDPHRIHLRGYSGGARLGSHLLAALPDRLASVCCVAGVRFVPTAGELPPLLAIHGMLDAVNPYAGGTEQRWSESVESAVHQWALASGCGPTSQHSDRSNGYSSAQETCYVGTTGGVPVRLITVADATHAWPGTTDGDHIAQFGSPGSFLATHAHWNFVQEVELRRTSP